MQGGNNPSMKLPDKSAKKPDKVIIDFFTLMFGNLAKKFIVAIQMHFIIKLHLICFRLKCN